MPATFYYGDMTFMHDKQFNKNFKCMDPLYVKIFTKHGNGVSLLHKFAVQKAIENDAATFSTKNGTTLKYAWDVCASKFKLSNGAFMFEAKAKPADWNNKDFSFEAKNATNFKTHNAAWDNTTAFKFGLPQTGPARLWGTLDFVYKISGDKLVKNSLNVQVADHFFLGSKIEHNTKDLTAAQFQFTHKEGKELHYLRWDNFSKKLVLGGHTTALGWKHPVFGQITWDSTKKTQGFQGQPVTLRYGTTFDLSDNTSLKIMENVGKHITVDGSWKFRFNDNLDFVLADQATLPLLGNTNWNYKAGLAFQFHF